MKRPLGALGITVAALLAAVTCRTTKTVVARLITATPGPANEAPAPSPTRFATPMPVVTAPASRYDREPGVFYEERTTPTPAARPGTPTAATPGAAISTQQATTPPQPTPTPADTPTAAPSRTPTARPSRTPTSGRPTPTHKPGAYYEDEQYRPAVTFTPTATRGS